MLDILFVHGTGVRRVSYDKSLSLVRAQADRYLKKAKVYACLWGEQEGARLRLRGASIPTYEDQTPAAISAREQEEVELATWHMLREDPLFELRLLPRLPSQAVAEEDFDPFGASAGEVSSELMSKLVVPPEFTQILIDRQLQSYWEPARKSFSARGELDSLLRKANRDPREVSTALARGLVASLVNVAIQDGHPGFTSETRDRLVELLIPCLGNRPMGPFDWVTDVFAGVAKTVGTYKARRERRALSDASFAAAGDVVLYQRDGSGIRGVIEKEILATPGDVVVFAHSLGGIAAVDLLAMQDMSAKVKGLVTIGTQAGFLFEIGALRSLRCNETHLDAVPAHFPRWLNFWDPNDFLSYSAEPVFGKAAVSDVMVRSKLPFPDSHSAYWDQKEVWSHIGGYFPWG